MSTRNILKNLRSAEVVEGEAKLPSSSQLEAGEIAVNYAKGHETISFKNSLNEIVSLVVNTVNDVQVNGTSVVSDKNALITMKGSTIPVGDTYTKTDYPESFDEEAEHIEATDKVDEALKKVEDNISTLVEKVIDNEEVTAASVGELANATGTINEEGVITYIPKENANYIGDATNLTEAVNTLDTQLKSIADSIPNNEALTNLITEKIKEAFDELYTNNPSLKRPY